jgi:hypothetical protein
MVTVESFTRLKAAVESTGSIGSSRQIASLCVIIKERRMVEMRGNLRGFSNAYPD